MNRRIHQFISAALALLVLLSTISWTVDKHLCMGRVMDIAFFHSADPCGMEEGLMELGLARTDNHCCSDESFTLQGQDDLQLSWNELDVEIQQFLISFSYSYLQLYAIPSGRIVPEDSYPPPLLVEDFTVLYEVFLI